jgi:sarcosine oxidase
LKPAQLWWDAGGVRTETFDAIVIGAGAAGSAAAWQLTRDCQRTLLLEQFEVGHTRGSSHGESRIFRFAYPQTAYAKFAMQSKPLWLELERVSNKKLLHSIGGLDFATEADCFGEVHQIAAALRQNGAACEILDAEQIRGRFPQFQIPDGTVGCYSPDGGWISATEAVRVMAAQATTLRESEPVVNISATRDFVRVETAKASYEAKRLVLAPGAWINQLLRYFDVELPLRITQEQPVYFSPTNNPAQFAPDRFPIWIHYRKPFFTYGFPLLENGFKAAFHHNGPVIDPARPDRTPDPGVSRKLREYLATYIPDAAGEITEEVTCLYTTTADHDFIIDLLPGLPNVAIASPCSGHGFKFATGIGRALADLVQHGRTEMEIGRCRFFSK